MMQEGIIKERAKDVEYIEKQYTRTIKEIDGKIRAWYQRLADNNGVSYAEAQKLLSKNELKDFHMTIEEYIEKGLSGGFEKELENASARVHISRLEALEMELQAHAEELTGKRIARMESAISDAYTESYYHTGYEVQQMAGVGVNMRKVDKKRLENVLARPWAADDKTFTARCWTDKNKLVNILEGELTRMVATGAAPDKAIKNIADAFNTSKANARRLVLTESAAIASVAEQDCYKELDVEEYEIVGTFDTKMCEDCASWHGQHFPRKDFKIGVNAPPFHPNCYCVTVPYFDDMAGIGERWMRNPETGKGEWIPSDMKYDDWKDIYVDKKYTLDDWKQKKGLTNTSQSSSITKDDMGVEFVSPFTGEIVELQKPQKYGNLADVCGEEYASGFAEKVEQSDETVRAIMYHGGGSLRVVDPNWQRTAEYSLDENGVKINASADMAGRANHTPFQTSFHEFGHNIDIEYGFSDNKELYDTIKSEARTLKKELLEYEDYPTYWDKQYRMENGAVKMFGIKWHDRDKILGGVSDTLEGFAGVSYPLGWGHGSTYWGTEKSGEKQFRVCTEFVAHYFESSVADPEFHAVMKKAFPKSWEVLERLIWEAIT